MSSADVQSLEVEGISVCYQTSRWRRPAIPVVQDVTFAIAPGQAVGLVGESGSGKSTIAKAILGLKAPSTGSIKLNNRDITHTSVRQRRQMVAELRAVFQDPLSSLSPFQTVGETLIEPLRSLRITGERAKQMAAETTASVGLSADLLGRLPYQLSGGQRQRLAMARALVTGPQVVVMDEPTSALDLSTQALVLNMLTDLREQHQYAMLFVSHDLAVVNFLCQRVVVLYRGMVVEVGPTASVIARPRHPYSAALTAAAPVPDPAGQAERRTLRKAATTPASTAREAAATGCRYAPRCAAATDLCRIERPELRVLDDHLVACHHAE